MKSLFLIFILLFSTSAYGKFRIYMTGGAAGAETFESFIKDANNGHIVVLKASEYAKDWYNDNIPKFGEVKSVTTHIVMDRTKANRQEVYDSVVNADGVFIAGGNQFNYHRWWKNTLLERAMNVQLEKNTPFVGTSAGLAILGEYYFSAHKGGISSDYAKKNPMTSYILIETGFLKTPYLANTITDTHFSERDRLGRLQIFMMRTQMRYGSAPRGIGVDEATSLVIDRYGQACVQGEGKVFLLENGQSKAYRDSECSQLDQISQ